MVRMKRLIGVLLAGLLIMSGLTLPGSADVCSFVDLPREGHWARIPIIWAVENGIAAGVNEDHFAPNEVLTRAQAITMIWRMKGSPAPRDDGAELPFRDVKSDAYYYQALCWFWQRGAVSGVTETRFAPNQPCSRAQLITFAFGVIFPRPDATVEEDYPDPVKDIRDFVDVTEDAYYYPALLNCCRFGIVAGTDVNHFSPKANCTRAQAVAILYNIHETNYYL